MMPAPSRRPDRFLEQETARPPDAWGVPVLPASACSPSARNGFEEPVNALLRAPCSTPNESVASERPLLCSSKPLG